LPTVKIPATNPAVKSKRALFIIQSPRSSTTETRRNGDILEIC
jgi:hypothetical protein